MTSLSRRAALRYTLIALTIAAIISVAFLGMQLLRRPQEIPSPTIRYETLYEPAILPMTPQPDGRMCGEAPLPETSWEEFKAALPAVDVTSGFRRRFPSGEASQRQTIPPATGMTTEDISPEAHTAGFFAFAVPPQTPLKIKYRMFLPDIPSARPIRIRMLVVLNEKQLTGAVEPAELSLRPGDEVTPTLKIPALDEGIHDLVIIGLLDPDKEADPYGAIGYTGSRYALLAGKDPRFFPRAYTQLPAAGSIRKGDPALTLELGLQAGNLKIWNWPETSLPVEGSQTLKFYAFAGAQGATKVNAPNLPQPEQFPFALLVFLDEQQVEVQPGRPVFYGQVAQDTAYAVIPAQVSVGDEAKRRNLLVLRIDYPGAPVCILVGSLKGQAYIFNHYPFARRVAIEVTP